jgi:hypothetical protein
MLNMHPSQPALMPSPVEIEPTRVGVDLDRDAVICARLRTFSRATADAKAARELSRYSAQTTIGFVCQLCVFRRSACRRLLDLGGRGLRLLIDNQLCQLSQRSIGRYLFVQGLLKKRPSPAETHRFSPGAERAVTGNLIVLDRLRRR